ncbi:zinc ABC transporter solute-binding protein [Halomonas sp. MCCC 1A11036]|uniref:Zinc ABC transporter solute-binding protein n=1 Tax=Billgrantia zhangzhouensis TaxID=2733481 RepID=A0ABS9AIC3_9GAMM|nr:zinc ABC transporter substrate-binding protein AztC [Halomonas zhangzhouensis]MCE8021523.1 zinc ABC transporter solute-binding protein [Halomonas zhangzhouensis]
MSRARKLALVAGLTLLWLQLLFTVQAEERLKVVATFSIIGDFAQQVGGERIELHTIVGPNADAHVYEPRPADAMALARADVVLTNGLMFEGFLTRLIEASGTTGKTIALTEGADILRDPEGGHYHFYGDHAVFHEAPFDPHAWQSVANAKVYVENIASAFCEADENGCPLYTQNAIAYLAILDDLHKEVGQAIAAIPEGRRVAVVSHHAFRYFEDEYGVVFLAPQGLSTEAEATAADVASLIDGIREQRAAGVFAENISNPRLVEQIADEAGLTLGGTLYSDALSAPDGPASTYVELMRHNATTLSRVLASD